VAKLLTLPPKSYTAFSHAAFLLRQCHLHFSLKTLDRAVTLAKSFPDWREGGHGQTNVRYALADSVNTFFYTIGGGV